eukprot:gnl/TRDRNA2_/TRDRNA2_94864_c0_seq2.p1 gnl/TRDRNA2_/TRDRNA2_94864_c0~~gnl/TRDRNA2_/TRDRNA2_94864_c0_seq2.p1  ORF type:complete len:258 (+),score=33.49 gnl/TRDRNA2_/TRDRNA2_94864_c0_seq2:67-840(+)
MNRRCGLCDNKKLQYSYPVDRFVRKATFAVEDKHAARLHTMVHPDHPGEAPALAPARVLDADPCPEAYFCLSAALRHLATGALVVVAATHLRWEFAELPDKLGASASKVLHAEGISRHLQQRQETLGAAGVVLSGDFNSPWNIEGAHGLLLGEEVACDDSRHPAMHPHVKWEVSRPLRAAMPMQSAYQFVSGHEPLYTRMKATPASRYCLDYIFFAGGVRAVEVGALPGEELSYLPNSELPSDHLPISADFRFETDG